jgi:hypothetical protein
VCPGQFGVVRGDRRRHHDGSRPLDVFRIVAGEDVGAECRHIGGTARIGVTAGDRNPSAARHKRQSAHAGTTDTHKMDGTRIAGVEQIHGWKANVKSVQHLRKPG